jgi:hypothetical protein
MTVPHYPLSPHSLAPALGCPPLSPSRRLRCAVCVLFANFPLPSVKESATHDKCLSPLLGGWVFGTGRRYKNDLWDGDTTSDL